MGITIKRQSVGSLASYVCIQANMSKGHEVGIDLSSTYYFFQHRKLKIIASNQGKQTTASYVTFTDIEPLFCDAAKNQVAMNPTNTVFDAKCLIGYKCQI